MLHGFRLGSARRETGFSCAELRRGADLESKPRRSARAGLQEAQRRLRREEMKRGVKVAIKY